MTTNETDRERAKETLADFRSRAHTAILLSDVVAHALADEREAAAKLVENTCPLSLFPGSPPEPHDYRPDHHDGSPLDCSGCGWTKMLVDSLADAIREGRLE